MIKYMAVIVQATGSFHCPEGGELDGLCTLIANELGASTVTIVRDDNVMGLREVCRLRSGLFTMPC